MDVYWPSQRATATVLFIHGGSLQESGERRSSPAYRNVCAQFVANGIACASMDYRLAPTHRWPAMPNDVALAIKQLKTLLASGKGDPSRIFLFGHSSGCHLAALVATNPEHLAAVGLATNDIAGIIPMGCTLDRDDATIRRLTAERIRAPFMREPQDVATFGTPENYLAANPASFIGKHVPPTLVVIAEDERFMPPVLEQASRFVRMLLENDVAANIAIVPGNHMSSVEAVSRAGDPALAAILKFINDPRGSAAKH
jgi:acetyl esterase/lipase